MGSLDAKTVLITGNMGTIDQAKAHIFAAARAAVTTLDDAGTAALPDGGISTAFSGWAGEADIRQGMRFASVRVTDTGLRTALIYSHSSRADFCFEPICHRVDAHNLPRQPGLVRFTPAQATGAGMTLI